MAKCRVCGEEFPQARATLGYSTCLKHGEQDAIKEILDKQKRVAPLYNKGGAMYLGKRDDAKLILKDAGKKNPEISQTWAKDLTVARVDTLKNCFIDESHIVKVRQVKHRQIGSFYLKGECYAWFEGKSLPQGAYRIVKFPKPILPRLGGKKT